MGVGAHTLVDGHVGVVFVVAGMKERSMFRERIDFEVVLYAAPQSIAFEEPGVVDLIRTRYAARGR